MDNNQNTTNQGNSSLENTETSVTGDNGPHVITPDSSESLDGSKNTDVIEDLPRKKPRKSISQRVQSLIAGANIYLLLFVLVLLLASFASYAS